MKFAQKSLTKPNQTVKAQQILENISAPWTWINFSFAALELFCKACSFNEPLFEDKSFQPNVDHNKIKQKLRKLLFIYMLTIFICKLVIRISHKGIVIKYLNIQYICDFFFSSPIKIK